MGLLVVFFQNNPRIGDRHGAEHVKHLAADDRAGKAIGAGAFISELDVGGDFDGGEIDPAILCQIEVNDWRRHCDGRNEISDHLLPTIKLLWIENGEGPVLSRPVVWGACTHKHAAWIGAAMDDQPNL